MTCCMFQNRISLREDIGREHVTHPNVELGPAGALQQEQYRDGIFPTKNNLEEEGNWRPNRAPAHVALGT
jgi:hypothetical protein